MDIKHNKYMEMMDVSISLIKLCGKCVAKPVSTIFSNCIDTGTISDIWKRSNIIIAYKKDDKKSVNNYRPFSLLPVLEKILEELLFTSVMNFLDENYLLNSNESVLIESPND